MRKICWLDFVKWALKWLTTVVDGYKFKCNLVIFLQNLIALKSGQPKSQQSMTKHPSNMQQDKQQNSHEVSLIMMGTCFAVFRNMMKISAVKLKLFVGW